MWTAYKQSLTPAREFDRVPIRPYWPSRKWKPRIWHTIFICLAFENPYWFLFNVNLLLFIVRYVKITVIFFEHLEVSCFKKRTWVVYVVGVIYVQWYFSFYNIVDVCLIWTLRCSVLCTNMTNSYVENIVLHRCDMVLTLS